MTKVSAIVLAAGLSSRMEGANKLFLPFGSRTIVGEVLHQLQTSDVDELVVVSSELTNKKIQSIISELDIHCKLVINGKYQEGMTTSIQVGLNACNPNADGYMICLGDMPKIDFRIYNKLTFTFKKLYINDLRTVLVPMFRGQKGNPAVFSSYYQEVILNHQEMEGCKDIIKDNTYHLNGLEVNSRSVLLDIDTRQDYDLVREKDL